MGAPRRPAAPPAGRVGGEAAGRAYASVSGIGRRGWSEKTVSEVCEEQVPRAPRRRG